MQAFITALVSPERLFRAGLRSVLVQAGHNVVGQWDSVQAIDSFSTDQTVLVLLDAVAPGQDLGEHIQRARERFDRALIVILGNEPDADQIRAARSSGASGFIAKDCSSQELLGLLEAVGQGETVFPIVQEVVEGPDRRGRRPKEPANRKTRPARIVQGDRPAGSDQHLPQAPVDGPASRDTSRT